MAEPDRTIAGLSPEKRAVLERYLLGEVPEPKPPACASIVPIQTSGSKAPIFWLHSLGGGGGGGLLAYWALAQLLRARNQPSFGIAGPAEPLTRIELMAAHYIEVMRTVQPRGPYRLGGYCFGGVVAFEMARQLAQRKAPVALVALLESHLPCSLPQPARLSPRFLCHFAESLPEYLRQLSAQGWGNLLSRLRRRAVRLAKKTARWGRFPNRRGALASSDLLESIIDMSRYPQNHRYIAQVHFEAYLRYVPQLFPGAVSLFRTRKPALFGWNPEVLWRQVALGGVDVNFLPGTHESILDYPHVRILAAQIQQSLDRAPSRNLPAHG